MGAPSKSDYADKASGNGVEVLFDDGGGLYKPHQQSGSVGKLFPRLNDGEVAQNDDDVNRCVWYNNEGRFYMDLKKSIQIDRINTYSWHRTNRAPQRFTLWGSNAPTPPSVLFTAGRGSGWTLIAKVDTWDLGQGETHGSSVSGKNGAPLGPFRYLLWVSDDVGEGTFFTEIDVFDR